MNYIKHLTGFFKKIAAENKLNPTHISLYLALFQCWNVNRFKNPTGISREEIMKASKINSNATYHKCMKELQTLGFIEYLPTFNPHSSSNVNMMNFSEEAKAKPKFEQLTLSNNEPVQKTTLSKNNKATEQVNELPHIYNNKQTFKNNKNIEIEPEFLIFNDEPFLEEENQKEKSSAKKEMLLAFAATDEKQIEKSRQKVVHPSLDLVKEFFLFQESSEFEAERFFNYYSSNGWLIGGKTKMKDWKASARNWILNTSKFTINVPHTNSAKEQPRAHNLHTVTDKNYAEPL
jgi:hypothetical protein